jgi:hypothetical protein
VRIPRCSRTSGENWGGSQAPARLPARKVRLYAGTRLDAHTIPGKFGWQHLQAALDSSPLLGAGRIEDTWNLIGRAVGAVVTCAAKALGRPRAQVVAEARLTLVDHSSLKAALAIDWDDPASQAAALERLLREVDRVEAWVAAQSSATQATPALQEALTALRAVLTQDLELQSLARLEPAA